MKEARVRNALDADLAALLAGAGITGPPGPLAPLAAGEDNQVYALRVSGRDLVVKAARTTRVRSGVAAWAAGRLAAAGVPVPTVLGYRGRLLVETRCPGTPLDQYLTHHRQTEEPVVAAGRLARRIHTVPVRGYGRLDATGVGLHSSPHRWLLQLPPLPPGADTNFHALRAQALDALRKHLPVLAGVPPVLLHGDWTSRHVIVEAGRISGVVDLESVRGGDPLADLAGWSLQEPAELTHGLYTGYFPTPPDHIARIRLALYRVRIAAAMLARHAANGEHTQLTLRTAQLQADLADLRGRQPAAQPRITPPSISPTQEDQAC